MSNELITIVERVQPTSKDKTYGMNTKFFLEGNGASVDIPEDAPKRRGRPPKTKQLTSGGEYIAADQDEGINNVSYKRSYEQTTGMLAGTIKDTDFMIAQVQSDLAMIRASKTLKRKYDYIGMLAGTATGLIGNKISAIREMNSSITNSHKLEMTRTKELKLNEVVDDDKKIADMYNAMLNIPVGAMPAMPFSNITPMQINGPMLSGDGTVGMVGVDVGNASRIGASDGGYQNYVSSMSPEQNAMVVEATNPYAKPVVIYNQETQDKFFDVMDMSTGQSIPNVPRPADFLLKDMRIDYRSNTARNSSANMEFPLILIGNKAIDEY